MSNIRTRIQFRPKRLSQSKSRQKFEPYRQRSPQKRHTESSENRQKMTLHEPIARIKSLMDKNSQKTKLKLNLQRPESEHRCMTHFSNYFYNNPHQNNDEHYVKLIEKIDHQTEFIKQGFHELNKSIKLPRLSVDEKQKDSQKNFKNEQSQIKIMRYMEQLVQTQKENSQLKCLIGQYQKEIRDLKNQLQSKNKQCISLLQQISTLKILTLISDKPAFSHKTIIEQAEHLREPSHLQLFHNFQSQQLKLKQTNSNLEDVLRDKEKEIEKLKIQNQMLSEEVNLLNYAISEEQKKRIQKQRPQPSQLSDKRIKKSQHQTEEDFMNFIEKKNEDFKPISDIQAGKSEQVGSNHSIRTKKTSSFLVNTQNFPIQELRNFHRRKSNYLNSSQVRRGSTKNHTEFFVSNSQFQIQQTLLRKSDGLKNKKARSIVDQSKIDRGKTFLKGKARDSFRRDIKFNQQNQDGKQSWIFSEKNMKNLELVRNTIAYKFKGFRYTYENLQQIFINRKNSTIYEEQIKQMLSEFPFLLSDHLISELMRYLFRGLSFQQVQGHSQRSMGIDKFSKILRQMIPSYELIDEEVEKVAMDRIKNILLENQKQIMSQALCYVENEGIIDYNTFSTILQQYKLNTVEIDLIIGQCSIISTDYEHLNYELYFQVLNSDPAESEQTISDY